LTASLACAPSAAAAPELDDVVQEVFLGEAVFAQGRLELQITNAVSYLRAGGDELLGDAVQAELGLTEDLQIEASAAGQSRRSPEGSAAGLGNSEVGMLYGLVSDRATGIALSAGLGVGFPAAKSGVGEDVYSLEPVVIVYKVLGPLHTNLSVAPEVVFEDDEAGTTVGGRAALSLLYPLGRFVPVLEIGGDRDDDVTVALAGGLLWHPHDDVEVGVAVVVGLTTESPDAGGFLHMAWEIELDDDHEEAPR
jgi:hypothetical protein